MAQVSLLIWICTVFILPISVLVLSLMGFPRYPQYRFRWGDSSESSHLNMYCLYLTYICPGAESNDYFHGTHSIDSDEVAQVSLLIWICTVYNFTFICPAAESNDYFHGTHSIDSDEMAQVSLLIWICTVYIFSYICPGTESNDYFHGTHSIDSDEVAQVSLLIWICTVYNFTFICPCAEYYGY